MPRDLVAIFQRVADAFRTGRMRGRYNERAFVETPKAWEGSPRTLQEGSRRFRVDPDEQGRRLGPVHDADGRVLYVRVRRKYRGAP